MRELQEITDNFCKERAIGEGAYGKVYKGALGNGKEIAVKLLHNRPDIDDGQFRRTEETIFAEEITKALCFEYMQKGSLQKHLYEESDGLDWETRYKIIKGTCEGLQYLHEGFKKPIYHLDLKPDNILLDENMFPKLADFGLSRLFREHKTMVIESVSGTIGYMPPEYIHENAISNKFDIFSLGVAITKVQTNWRRRLRSTCSSHKQLKAHCHQVNICTEIALSCMEYDRHKRPDIIDIIHRLNDTEATIDRVKLHTFTSKAILCGKTCNKFPVLVRITAAPWRHTEEMPRAGVDIVVVVDINMGRVSHWKLKTIKQALMTVIDKFGPNDRFSIVWFKGSVPHTMKLTFTSNKGKEIAKVMINELDGTHDNNTIAALREGFEYNFLC
ncbi:cysteine-rich receptor-like protein kinase 44 [Aegilops tauschii subsp. strangulata]|uniref:cysteine-rich receptor-like protein kinase 44 n=1 Tax=Aegilops tauschii subsp. strangulata TaxID=200361 RepID=UPI003CC894C8